MIPEGTLNQIQERIDIVEVVGSHVQLRRAGKNFKACCPFHMEKTPSFIVNPDKQIFHCFGCNAGGNVFTFLMKIEKKDFREVVEALADRAGVEIPKDRPVDEAAEARRNEVLKAHRLAAQFYQNALWKEASASPARAYLKNRGLADETVKAFGLGWAPEAWEILGSALKADVSEKVLERAGLLLPGKDGGHYDRFRKRILFPILDQKGACIAFGGRVMDDSQPKYLNSPETEIYSKGRHLYGLFQARQTIRTEDAVIVVEGYMDVIGCHQAGVTNAVASLGTALTAEQARLVKRHTKNVFMLYDADAAGENATLRGLEIFLEEGMEVRIVRLPAGHDPDSYILKNGIAAFREEMARAKSLFEYKLALLKAKYDAKTVEGRVKIAGEMVALFSKVKNEILLSAWTQELARELGVSEASVKAELERAKGGKEARAPKAAEPEALPAARLTADARLAEKILIGLLLENKNMIERAKQMLTLEDFQNEAVRRIVARLFAGPVQETSAWMNAFAEDTAAAEVLAMAVSEAEKAPEKERAFEDCLVWMERSRIDLRRELLRSEIAEANRLGDQIRLHRLLNDITELNKGMKRTHEKSQ
jgi:DNA primase